LSEERGGGKDTNQRSPELHIFIIRLRNLVCAA
jgi:hypothetical protein